MQPFRFNDNQKKIFREKVKDFKNVKKSKVEIDKLITTGNELYEGKPNENTPKNRSKLVMKEIAKQIEWTKPNITEPFLSTQNPIRITGPLESRARIMQKYGNMMFAGEFDRTTFMDKVSDVMIREGTVWLKHSWISVSSEVAESHTNISMERLMGMSKEPDTIEQNLDGTFNVTFMNESIKKNKPHSEVLRNENVYPDPSARHREEMDFIMVRRYETVSSLRATGLYSEEVLNRLTNESQQNTESSLANDRNNKDESYGVDVSYKRENRSKIAIIEYWGEEDINGDGNTVPTLMEWAEKAEVYLRMEENPMPNKEMPFDVAVYSSRPFSIWGNSLAFFLGDSQKVKSGMMRGIMDNLSNANNGQTFAMRGALDYVNFKRWKNGERHVIVNKHPSEAFHEGNFNNLPPAIFNTLQMVDSEIEKLSGVQAGAPAINGGASNDGDSQLTMAQQRMVSTVRNVSNLVSKMIKNWISMAEYWLEDEQIAEMFTESEAMDMNAFRDSGSTIIKMSVATEVSKMMRVQQLNMLMQQSKTLEASMPPQQLNVLVAEMYEMFDMYDQAEALRTYEPPPPSEQELKMQNLEMEAIELANAKLQAEINELNSRAQNNTADAEMTLKYKEAQTAEKYAKAQSHEVETSLKPVKQMLDIETASTQNKGGQE